MVHLRIMSNRPVSLDKPSLFVPKRTRGLLLVSLIAILALSAGITTMVVLGQENGGKTASGSCQDTDAVVVNGTRYSCLDVTAKVDFASPGYSLLKNPVTFLGIGFQTICPPGISNCGNQSLVVGQSSNTTVIRLAVISLNITFADNNVSNVFALFPLHQGAPTVALANHGSSKAGVLLEYSPGASPVNVRVILLVGGQ